VVGTIALNGALTAADITDADQEHLKTVIAQEVGSVCGPCSCEACTAANVAISIQRRGVTVTYAIPVYTETAATSGSALLNHADAPDRIEARLKVNGGAFTNVDVGTITGNVVSADVYTPPPPVANDAGVQNDNTTAWWLWIIVGLGGTCGFCCLGIMFFAEQYGESSDPRVMDCFNPRDGHSCWYKLCYFIWYYGFFGCLFHKALHRGKPYNPRRTNPNGDCWYNAWFFVWYTFMLGCLCDTKPSRAPEEDSDGVEMDGPPSVYKKPPGMYARAGVQI
jgi:hypothetical protein